MTSMFRIATASALVLSTTPVFASEYHGPTAPNFDDATYYFEQGAPAPTPRESLQYDVTTMKVRENAAVEAPRPGEEARTRYDPTTMKFEETTAHPMEQ